jgi:filamentous hemagglutinin family protein
MNRHASMNRIFRLVWNESLNSYVPAAETARGRGKSSKHKLIATALSLSAWAGIAQAGPTGGQVTAGSGTITSTGATTTIQQSSQNLALAWQTFNIAPQETVNFLQPNAAAIAVNRIFGANGSTILGHLNANGQVYLINPNGVLFGKGAEVNVGGLVASTLNLNESTLGEASKSFSGPGSGTIVNDGTLTAAAGGSIALLGNHVSNTGAIYAQLGTAALGAGSAVTLTFSGTHLVSMQVDQSVLNSVAANGGLIRANGGTVLMTAGAQKSLLASLVNNTGVIEARTIENHDGTITLLGGMNAGAIAVAGTLDASAPNAGNGGAIETSAARVTVAANAKVTTAAAMGLSGTWLIDPTDFTIGAGNGSQTVSGVGATTLQAELANGNVSIATNNTGTQNGDINVNAPLSWSANKLTLTSANDIDVNAVMTMSGTAKVDFEPGSGFLNMGFTPSGTFAGRVDISSSATNALTISNNVYTIVNSLGSAADSTTPPASASLQGIAATANLNGYFALGGNIDASATSGWNSGAGFTPIGNVSNNFAGVFDGLGHTITNLTINRPSLQGSGLFGFITFGGELRNVGMVGGSVSGLEWVGELAGFTYGDISNSYATGNVSAADGGQYIGGLAGNTYGSVINSYAKGAVTAGANTNDVGGLVGDAAWTVSNSYAAGNVSAGTGSGNVGGLVGVGAAAISSSYATGMVAGGNYVGGLVGRANATVTGSHATGDVTATGQYVGGLAGENAATVISSYATGNVSGANYTGGLVGANFGSVTSSHAIGTVSGANSVGGLVGGSTGQGATPITDSYATGSVNGSNYVGGLIGSNNNIGTIATSFATGSVTGGRYTGGLVGMNQGSVTNTYSVGSVSGTLNVGGLIGMNLGMVSNSYSSGLVSGGNFVGALIGANYGTLTNGVYGRTVNPSLTGVGGNGAGTADVVGTVVGLSSSDMQTEANFTSATSANGNMNTGWDFAATWIMYEGHTNPLLQAFMTPLTVNGTIAQTYDGAAFAPSVSNLAYSTTPDFSHIFGTVTVTGNAVGAVHPGTYTYTPGGLYSDQLGYIFTFPTSTLTINPAPLSVTGTSVGNKVYNGSAVASLAGGTLSGVIPGDTVTLTQTGTFGSKNAATDIAVTATDGLRGADAGDYTLVEPMGLTGTITPALLTVAGSAVGSKVYNGTDVASLIDGSLVGVVIGDTVTLIQSGKFATTAAGSGIAVTATDSLSGASAGDYSILEPTGLTGTILPAPNSPNAPSDLELAAFNARTQIVQNFIYPQLGANPQVINASPTIAVLATSADDGSGATTGSHQAIAVNVSMKIGANGTLKIENGGLRLPSDLVVGK